MGTDYLLTGRSDRENLEAYRGRGGYEALERALAEASAEDLLRTVERSGLRGRGGAGFPAGRKWRLAAETQAPRRFVIANGGEHEPGSGKDRFLVAVHPHAVLEGALFACIATGADTAYVYLIEDMRPQIEAVEAAIGEAREAGLLETANRFAPKGFRILVHLAPPTYVAGEETAAIDAIEGGPGKPRSKPPLPGQAGLFGMPTTVSNVETLAHVAALMRMGVEAFRGIGTEESKGTMLFTLDESFVRPGIHERPFGTTWRELFDEAGGGLKDGGRVRAILPSQSSAWIDGSQLDTPIAYETLGPLGSGPGCGGVRVLREGEDPLPILVEIARFFHGSQCGQCPPCNMVTTQIRMVLEGLARGVRGDFLTAFDRLEAFAAGKGRCSLMRMDLAPTAGGVRLFRNDLGSPPGPEIPETPAEGGTPGVSL